MTHYHICVTEPETHEAGRSGALSLDDAVLLSFHIKPTSAPRVETCDVDHDREPQACAMCSTAVAEAPSDLGLLCRACAESRYL